MLVCNSYTGRTMLCPVPKVVLSYMGPHVKPVYVRVRACVCVCVVRVSTLRVLPPKLLVLVLLFGAKRRE